MPLEKLDLSYCEELTGKPVCTWGGPVKVMPQGNIKGQAPLNHVQPPHPLPSHIGVDRAKLQQMLPNCNIFL